MRETYKRIPLLSLAPSCRMIRSILSAPIASILVLLSISITNKNIVMAQEGEGMAPASFSGTILDNINNLDNLRGVSLALRTFCGFNASQILSSPNVNITFFAPIDSALNQTFDTLRVKSAGDFGCLPYQKDTQEETCQSGIFSSRNLTLVPFVEISRCFPELFSYHIVNSTLNLPLPPPDNSTNVGDGSSSSSNSNSGNNNNIDIGMDAVYETMLNSTRLVNLNDTSSQVVAFHRHEDGNVDILHGAWPPARVVNSTTGNNGIVYMIDQVLIPPSSLFNTLSRLNMTLLIGAIIKNNQTDISLLPGITMFAVPDSGIDASSSSFNITSYVVSDQVFYINTTNSFSSNYGMRNKTLTSSLKDQTIAEGEGESIMGGMGNSGFLNRSESNNSSANNEIISLQAMDGTTLSIVVESDGTVRVNNATIVQPNILLKNGVVHLLDRPFAASSNNNSSTVQGDGNNSLMGNIRRNVNNTGIPLPPFRQFWRRRRRRFRCCW